MKISRNVTGSLEMLYEQIVMTNNFIGHLNFPDTCQLKYICIAKLVCSQRLELSLSFIEKLRSKTPNIYSQEEINFSWQHTFV